MSSGIPGNLNLSGGTFHEGKMYLVQDESRSTINIRAFSVSGPVLTRSARDDVALEGLRLGFASRAYGLARHQDRWVLVEPGTDMVRFWTSTGERSAVDDFPLSASNIVPTAIVNGGPLHLNSWWVPNSQFNSYIAYGYSEGGTPLGATE